MATPIEYGLVAALVAVVILTGVTAVQHRRDKPSPPPPTWHCPAGTVMLPTSNYYPRVQPACIAGVYATLSR